MAMLRVLFAEDETAAREGILAAVDWDSLELKVRAAQNGLEALAAAEDFPPDILLTDIKMPQMNGIELSKKILELNPKCSILMISGYSEVDYLKSAIALHAVSYIDKPVDLGVLTEQLKDISELQQRHRRQIDLLKDKISNSLCYAEQPDGQLYTQLQEVFPNLGNCFTAQAYMARVISESRHIVPDSTLIKTTAKLQQMIKHEEIPAIAGMYHGHIHISFFGKEPGEPDISGIFYNLIQNAAEACHVYLCVGLAVPLSEYRSSFTGARELARRIFYDIEPGIYTAEAETPAAVSGHIDLDIFSGLLAENKKDEAKSFIQNLTNKISLQKYPSPHKASELYFKILLMLMDEGKSFSSVSKVESAAEWLGECVFLKHMELEILKEIDNYFEEKSQKQYPIPIEQILRTIHKDYDKELSLGELSRKYYISNVYLCVKFKEYTGKTFVRYLTEYRIQRAAELLTNTSMRISEIAGKTGFEDGSYFSKTFKKEKGMTPAEYRKKNPVFK